MFESAEKLLSDAEARGMRKALIITALPLELAAVRAHLNHLGSVMTANKDAVFEFEQFSASGQEWLVVTGESGAEVLPAGIFVKNALQEFGPFEIIFFVGVAATRKPDDAPVGSVMVSRHVYLAEVGKYKDGKFQARSRMLHANPILHALAQKVVRDAKWQARIAPPYADTSPGEKNYPEPFPPDAVVCPIVSVNSVSADPDSALEEHISQTYQDATGLEMEGYGALFAAERELTPCIVIRGVSDDREHKEQKLDKIHQPIAAGHATAFALELLDVWSLTQESPSLYAQAIVTPTNPPAAPTLANPEENAERTEVVEHLPGSAADYPAERRDQLLAAFRSASDDETAEIVGTEEGSFHLFISMLKSRWDKLNPTEFANALEERSAVRVFGVSTVEEFRSADEIGTKLLAASQPLLNWPQTLPDGTSITRPELTTLIAAIDGHDSTAMVLLGKPGSGKTSLLAKLADTLKANGTPFLAIKADLLDASVKSEEDLRAVLALPSLPSTMLTDLAQVRPVVLIIDQLDALAGYLDLQTGRLSVLLNLVRQLASARNIKIVLSARTFEYEHDARLKSVQASSLNLELPAWSEIEKLLKEKGINAAAWPADAQDLLRTPQQLATFLKLPNSSQKEPFLKYHSMLEMLWQERLLKAPNGPEVVKLASRIAEDMAEKEVLWVSRARYDDRVQEIEILLANAILSTPPDTPASIGFSHQTVFEYALARLFAQNPGELTAYVLSREGSLFVRPKLWASLTYLRAVELPTYEGEIKSLWDSENLRDHLQLLLVEFIGQQTKPTEMEAVILGEALSSPAQRRIALQSISESPGWFHRLKNTHIAQAMKDPGEAGIAVPILMRAGAVEDVIELIEENWLPDQQFDTYSWYVLEDASPWSTRHLEAAKRIIDRTNIAPFAFDGLLMTVGAEQPEYAIKLAAHRLTVKLSEASAEAERRAALPEVQDEQNRIVFSLQTPGHALEKSAEEGDGWDSLEALAKAAPEVFLHEVWPWFHNLLELLRGYEKGKVTRRFPVWGLDLRFEEEGTLNLPERPILGALRVALETLAAAEGNGFIDWLAVHGAENAEPAQRLFANALAVEAERYASRSFEFFLHDQRRFHLGNIEDLSETSKRLVRRASPFWTDGELALFIKTVRAYTPEPEEGFDASQRKHVIRDTAKLRLELLEELPQDRLSQEILRFIAEEQRRFGVSKRGSTFSGPMSIGSPMSSEEIGLASDDDVINAFNELPDATDWDNPKTWEKGGNIQLSRALAEYAKTDPERVVSLLSKLTPETGSRAAGYALDTMAEQADPNLIVKTLADLDDQGFGGEEFRGNAARAIERLIRRDIAIDDVTLDRLMSWLAPPTQVEPEEPDEDEDLLAEVISDVGGRDKSERVESILWGMGGGSTLPQGNYPILESIVRVLLARRDPERALAILSKHLEMDEDERVWSALIRFFRYLVPKDTAQLSAFLTKLYEKYPNLVHTRETAISFAYLHWNIPDFIHQMMENWKAMSQPRMQQAFGEITTLVWLMQPKLTWTDPLIEYIVTAAPEQARTGAAYACINVWSDIGKTNLPADLLIRIIALHEEEPWGVVMDIFRLVDEIEPTPDWSRLLEVIADEIPRQKTVYPTFVVERLQTLLPHKAGLVARLALALTEKWKAELADMATDTASAAPELVDLAITLHRLSPDTRDEGIKLFEQLLYLNAYTARDTLNQIDNRFPGRGSVPARRRLPRRSRKSDRKARRAATA
ncbi:phosphorylase family protein [Roseibium sp. LAB1]